LFPVKKKDKVMIGAILGQKLGMTRIFNNNNRVVSVSLVKAGPCYITGLRTAEKDGYTAVRLGYGELKENRVSKPLEGYFKKNNVPRARWMKEFRMDKLDGVVVGQAVKTDIFAPGEYVDVSGYTKGKGFQGVVKRHNFRGGPRTHGQSDRLRAPGAIGAQRPQRVLKGTRMAGHMGNEWTTIMRLEVVKVLPENDILVLKGSIPGPDGGFTVVQKTHKKRRQKVIIEAERHKPKGKGKAPGEFEKQKQKKK